MTPKTEYKGHEIEFMEHLEEWSCRDLDIRNPSLPNLKKNIDGVYRKMRKASAFPCFLPSRHSYSGGQKLDQPPVFQSVTIVEYAGPIRKKKSFERVGTGEIEDHEVWIMRTEGNKQGRSKVKLSSLVLPTLEEREELRAEYWDNEALIRKLQRRNEEILKTPTPVAFDQIADIVAASETKLGEENE